MAPMMSRPRVTSKSATKANDEIPPPPRVSSWLVFAGTVGAGGGTHVVVAGSYPGRSHGHESRFEQRKQYQLNRCVRRDRFVGSGLSWPGSGRPAIA